MVMSDAEPLLMSAAARIVSFIVMCRNREGKGERKQWEGGRKGDRHTKAGKNIDSIIIERIEDSNNISIRTSTTAFNNVVDVEVGVCVADTTGTDGSDESESDGGEG